jgi:hypothetical protein
MQIVRAKRPLHNSSQGASVNNGSNNGVLNVETMAEEASHFGNTKPSPVRPRVAKGAVNLIQTG